MSGRDLETLFIAFRERGDVAALSAAFDQTSDELLTLALHLVPEPAQAEDLVQATFLTAIERADSFDRTRPFMPWLVGILARHAASARRERARTPDATRIETRIEPDPSDEVERAEVSRILARAVEALPEPYRAAVKRHVLDGERAVDIARQSGIAAGTVRMHILRGLERLRRALPATMFGAGAWSVRGSDSVRSVVLEAARAKARIPAASATTSTATGISATLWTMGGVFMLTKILLGAAALAVGALCLWNLAPGHATPTASIDLAANKPVASQRDLAGPPAESDLARQPAAKTPAPSTPNSTSVAGWWLTGSVIGLDGKPAEDTVITVRRILSDEMVKGPCDPSGHFAFDVSALFATASPAELLIDAQHPANRDGNAIVPVSTDDLERGRATHVDITARVSLTSFARVVGHVSVPGHAADNCYLGLFPGTANEDLELGQKSRGSADAQGRFEFRVDRDAAVIVRAGCDGYLPAERTATAVLGETSDVGTIELGRGDLKIEGSVHLPFDRGSIGLRVIAQRADSKHGEMEDRSYCAEEQLNGLEQFADVYTDGHFSLTGISSGTWKLALQSRTDGVRIVWQESVTCGAPSSGVVLGTRLGRVVVAVENAGKSRPGVRVMVRRSDWNDQLTTGPDGRATFLCDLDHDLEFDARIGSIKAPRSILPAAERGPDVLHVIQFPIVESGRATLVLQPVGVAPESVVLILHKAGSFDDKTGRADLADGKYTLADVLAGTWKAEVAPPSVVLYGAGGGEFLCNDRFDLELADGQVLTRSVNFVEGGRVHVEIDGWTQSTDANGDGSLAHVKVLDEADQDVGAVFAVRKYDKGSMKTSTFGGSLALNDPSEMAQAIRPGVYRLVLDSKVWETPPISFRVFADTTVTVRVPLTKR